MIGFLGLIIFLPPMWHPAHCFINIPSPDEPAKAPGVVRHGKKDATIKAVPNKPGAQFDFPTDLQLPSYKLWFSPHI